MTDLVTRLKSLDSCAVSDALDKLGLSPAVTGISARSFQTRIVGRVITVKLGVRDPNANSTRHLCTHAIETASAVDIIVIEQKTGIDAAGWGGVLSNAAKERGIAGCIVEGPARDIDEARDIGFAVYSRSATARTARGRIQELDTGIPISVGEVTVSTGDYVIADASGIAFLPAEAAERIIDTAQDIAAREAAMTRDIRAGGRVSQIMGATYESMLKGKP